MQFSHLTVLSQFRFTKVVSSILHVIVGLLLLAATPLFAENPYEAAAEEKGLVKSIEAKIQLLPTLSAKLEAYRSAFETYSTQADFSVLCELMRSANNSARRDTTTENPLDSFQVFMESFDFEELSIRQQNHVKFLTSRFQAFDGRINGAERGLLEILNLDEEEVHPYTTTSAHYMAAFCSYYTNQLERSANHARKAAEGFLEMGDKPRALEAYDGASTTFFKLSMVDSALFYARKGLALREGVEEDYIANLYLNYAEALMGNRQADSAFYYARLADDIIKVEGRAGAKARSQLCLANITSLSGSPRESVPYYHEAIKQFKIAKETYHQVDALDSLVKIHASLGEYHLAYDASKQSFRMRDSLREDRLKKDADRVVAEYQRDVLKKELDESESDRALAQAVLKRRQSERVSMFGIICSLLLLISFIYYRAVTRKRLTRDLQAQVNQRTAVLRQNSKRLEVQAQRLQESNAELERFAYIASHDLKTPLRNVTSFLGLIQRRLPADSLALVQEYLDIALTNACQMHDLVTDVLEFSRLNSDTQGIKETVTVSAAVDSIRYMMLSELEERNAQLVVTGDAKLVLPKGSLEQILGNLIGNAVKYNESKAPLVQVFVTEMDERVRLTVKDNGIGIAPEYHERIFEVFRRLHTIDKYSGTGVGLAACRKVVLRLGGSVSLDSKVGEGSVFHVDLPAEVSKDAVSRRPLMPNSTTEA